MRANNIQLGNVCVHIEDLPLSPEDSYCVANMRECALRASERQRERERESEKSKSQIHDTLRTRKFPR